MKISPEQVHRALEYLQTTDRYKAGVAVSASGRSEADLVRRVVDRVQQMPDVRAERVQEGRELGSRIPDAATLAQSVLNRVVSDAIR